MNAFHDIPSGQLKIGTHMTFEILSTALLAPLTKHVAKLAFEGDLGIAIVEGTLDLGFLRASSVWYSRELLSDCWSSSQVQ